MPYTLGYKDRFMRVDESRIESDTSDSVAFASLPDNEPTLLLTNWTGRQFTKLLSALKTGAELMFPEEANEILWQLVKIVHQPIPFTLPEGGSGCIEYGTTAGFVRYSPDHPFIAGDKAAGWNKEAWYSWGEFDTLFPDWIDNWLGGVIEEITGYQTGDVLFNIESIPINPIDAFLGDGGLLPKVEVHFSGTGVVEVTLLSFPLGGKAIIELDEEPNVLDILTGGILDPNALLVELARDIVNFPPDEDPVVIKEISVEAPGDHILYIVYIPIVDDSLLPIGFGGGFRGVELCGFEEEAVSMGIDSVIWDDCGLKTVTGGVETIVVTAETIQACMDIPEGGGGGAALTVKTYRMGNVGFGTVTAAVTSFTDISGCHIVHTPTRSNMLVIAENIYVSNSAGNQPITLRMVWGGSVVGLDAREQAYTNSAIGSMAISDRWEVTPSVEQAIDLQWKTPSGTMTRSERETINVTIIEWDELEDLFVQDIQVLSDGTIQKKIGGVWLDVSIDLATLLNSISATASAAAATAAAAQSTANTATTVNATQTAQIASIITVNNTQATQITGIITTNTAQGAILTAHEARLDDIDLSIVGLVIEQADQNGRLDTLEMASGGGDELGSWGGYRLRAITDINANGGKYSSSENTWDNGEFPYTFVGWEPDETGRVLLNVENAARYNSMAYCRIGLVVSSWTGGYFRAAINAGEWGNFKPNSSGIWTGWLKIPNVIDYDGYPNQDLQVTIQAESLTDEWRVKSFVWCYINVNPFDGTTSDT